MRKWLQQVENFLKDGSEKKNRGCLNCLFAKKDGALKTNSFDDRRVICTRYTTNTKPLGFTTMTDTANLQNNTESGKLIALHKPRVRCAF